MFDGGYKEFQKVWNSIKLNGVPLSKKELHNITNISNFTPKKKIYYQILKSEIETWESSEKGVVIAEKAFRECKKIDDLICRLDAGLNLAWQYRGNYQYNEALEQINRSEELLRKISKITPYTKQREVILYRCKGQILAQKGDLDNAEKACLLALKLNEEVKDKFQEYHIYNSLVWIKTPQGKFEEILQHESLKLELAKEIGSKSLLSFSYDNLAAINQWIGEYDIALDYIHKTIKLRKEIQNKEGVISAKNRLALHYWYAGELEKSIEIFNETIPIRINSNSLRQKCFGYWNKSLVEWYKGELDEAIKSGTKAVEFAKEMNDKVHQDTFSIFLAAIYFDKGNFDKALELCEMSIKDAKKHGEKFHIAFANYVIAMVYQVKGKLDLAWEYAQQSLKIRKEMKITHHIIESLFSLIQIMLDKNDIVQAKAYQTDLQKIVEENPKKRFLLINTIAQGMILKSSSKPRNWIKAIDIFLEISKDEIITHSLTVIALIQLCELLIQEFSISGEPDVLLELESYTEQLEEIARKQKTYKLRIEACHIRILTLWLKAQFSIADIDIQKAKELLTKAREMADEEGLILLAEKIIQQQGQLNDRIDKWDGFIRKYYEFLKD
ncbi:MAG: tetratricopeptide repeat protein [Candidatus Heimdallarchaeota archaeon]